MKVEFEKFVRLHPVEKAKDERIVCGVVYEPDTEDSQGDQASAAEIRKAAHQFMEKVQLFKVNHKGQKAKIKVLESYIVPEDITIAKQKVKKGSWVIAVRVLDKKVWEAIKKGELTGFSMAGYAVAKGNEGDVDMMEKSSEQALWPSISQREEVSKRDNKELLEEKEMSEERQREVLTATFGPVYHDDDGETESEDE